MLKLHNVYYRGFAIQKSQCRIFCVDFLLCISMKYIWIAIRSFIDVSGKTTAPIFVGQNVLSKGIDDNVARRRLQLHKAYETEFWMSFNYNKHLPRDPPTDLCLCILWFIIVCNHGNSDTDIKNPLDSIYNLQCFCLLLFHINWGEGSMPRKKANYASNCTINLLQKSPLW